MKLILDQFIHKTNLIDKVLISLIFFFPLLLSITIFFADLSASLTSLIILLLLTQKKNVLIFSEIKKEILLFLIFYFLILIIESLRISNFSINFINLFFQLFLCTIVQSIASLLLFFNLSINLKKYYRNVSDDY